mgnify:CR=1 FL=1
MEEDKTQEFTREPDVDVLKADLERCRTNLAYWINKAEDASEVRRNEWPGKGRYGRKEGPDSFPWEGASDLEPNLINPLIDGDVALLKSSLNKANLVAAPVESGDISTAKTVTEFMRWRMSTMDELPREAGVAANHLLETGICFLGVYWKREVRRIFTPITIDEIAAMNPELATAIQDPDMKDEVADLLGGMFPNLKKPRLKKMLNELRKKGETEMPGEKVTMNRPAIRAYELGRDIIIDSNVMDLQQARNVYCIHYYTPEALMEKTVTDGWSEEFCSDAIDVTTGDYDTDYQNYGFSLSDYQKGTPLNYEGLVRLVTCYRKETDEDGVPVCTTTVFSEKVEGYAKYSTQMYDPGKYPFVAITREHLSRRLLDSRGYPELLRSYQLAVKTEMDSRRDRASMSTVPPVEALVGRRPEKLGPGAVVSVRRRGEVGFMEIPAYSPASTEVETHLRSLANKITGRATGPDDAVDANVIRQSLVNVWLDGWKQILRQLWTLERTYGGPEIWFRVTNNEQGVQLLMDETAETYDFEISWNTQNADEEKVLQKLETVGTILAQYDRQGQARYDQFLRTFLEAVDPNLASKLIMPANEATTKEIIETSQDIAKIFSGQVVNAPQGANSQLRLQVVQQWMQGTPEIPADDVQARMQSDEKFAQRIETYVKQLEFMQTQQQNALVGQLGTAPGNVPGSAMQQ